MKRDRFSFHFNNLKSWARKFATVILILSAFFIMLVGKSDTIIVEKTISLTMDVVTPIMRVLSIPAKAISNTSDEIKNSFNIKEENRRLRIINDELIKWKSEAFRLRIENQNLSDLLNYITPPEAKYLTAHIVAEESGAFAHSVIAYTGYPNNSKKGQAAVSAKGLVGRVDKVGVNSSRVILLTDINSRIPVVVEETRVRGILAGNNTSMPNMRFIALDSEVNVGDRIVTSGIAGVFPPGIPVGIIKSTESGIVKVRPTVNLDQLEYIKIVDYGLKGILDETKHIITEKEAEEDKLKEKELEKSKK